MKGFKTFVLAVLASIFMIGAPIAAADESAEPTPATAIDVQAEAQPPVDDFTSSVEESVNVFFAENGLATQVQFVNLTSEQAWYNPCGSATSSDAYYYCPTDKVAYIGIQQSDYFNEGTHWLSGAMLIAHEGGHALQHAANPDIMYSEKKYENGADCVGGAWLHWYSVRENINLGIEGLTGFWALAEKIQSPAEWNDTHGTKWERGAAMLDGYVSGLRACNDHYAPVFP